MIPESWIAVRRHADAEVVGWVEPLDAPDAGVRCFDRLGRFAGEFGSAEEAEAALAEHGLSWLGEAWAFRRDPSAPQIRVRIVELGSDSVVLKEEDWGSVDAEVRSFRIGFPVSAEVLSPWR